MAIPKETVTQMSNEGITTVSDLVDFDEKSLQRIANNLRRPGGRIPDPTPGAPAGTTIPTPPFVFGAKSQSRLEVACNLIRFYETIGRPLTASNLKWTNVMRRFGTLWENLIVRKNEVQAPTPKITKELPILKWVEPFKDHLCRCIGGRIIPLIYVVRTYVTVTGICPPLAMDQPFSEEHGSIDEDLIARASHEDGLFPQCNSDVYYKMEEATRGTIYADSIKPFQRKKDGRGAFLTVVSQYAGKDKWEAILKTASTLLITRKWKGAGSNHPLELFVQQHRAAFVSMQTCSLHVDFQLPNGHTRVGYLLDAIECDDASLQAAMAKVEEDDGPDGKRNNFETAASHLLPKDPVVKKRLLAAKRSAAQISEVDAGDGGSKTGIGYTGVHFRYHTPSEFNALTQAQKSELREHRSAGGGRGASGRGASGRGGGGRGRGGGGRGAGGGGRGRGGRGRNNGRGRVGGGRGHGSRGGHEVGAAIALAEAGDTPSNDVKSFIMSLFKKEMEDAARSAKASVSAVAAMPTEASKDKSGVGAAPNMGAGSPVSLANILRKAAAKDLVPRKGGKSE